MYPRDDGKTTFKYPDDRLLPLRDIITEKRMREPDMLIHDNEACLLVIKNGNATDVTIGRATGIFSLVRDDETLNCDSSEGRTMHTVSLSRPAKILRFIVEAK
jgi:hypothetical protein